MDVFTIFIVLLFSFGSVGNVLIIISFLYKHKDSLTKMSSHHFLITVLAGVDLLICVIYITTFSSSHFARYTWLYFPTVRAFSCWILVVISYDRFRSIAHPFKGKSTKKRLFAVLAITFFVISFIYLPFTLTSTLATVSYPKRLLWIASNNALLDVILPFSLMCGFYRRISCKLKKDLVQSAGNNQLFLKRNSKAMHVLRMLIVVYFICVVPMRIYLLIKLVMTDYLGISLSITSRFITIHAVIGLNNMLNVVIYAYMMSDFRKFLMKVFTCKIFIKERQ